MATKNNPGAFKCYEAALPDEEFFTALARDLAAPATVDFWCDERERLGLVKTEDDRNRINEARRVAQQMRMWRAKAVLDATANNEEPIWRQPRQIMDDGPPVCMGAMRDPITVKTVLTRLLDTTLDGLHHGVLGEVATQIQEALTAIDRDTETVATPFEVSGAIQKHDYYIIGERSPLSYDALCVRLDRLDAIRLAAKEVHDIKADLKDFDGDRRGISAALGEATEKLVEVVLEVCPDEGEYPAELKAPVAEAKPVSSPRQTFTYFDHPDAEGREIFPLSPVRICELLDYATAYGEMDETTPNGTVTPMSTEPMSDMRRAAIVIYKRVLGALPEDFDFDAVDQGAEARTDMKTHYRAWRTALSQCIRNAPHPTADQDDAAYWRHEREVLDRTFRALGYAPGPIPQDMPRVAMEAEGIKLSASANMDANAVPDDGEIADAARRIASWVEQSEGQRAAVYKIAKAELAEIAEDAAAVARSEAGTVSVMTTGLIMVHGRPMDIREIENALAEEKLDEYRKRYPTPDYLWPGTELKPTLDTAPEDLAHAPEVPGHRFSTFIKHGRYAYARGLEIAPMHLPRALEAMAEDGWGLVSIFGETDSQNVGFIFQRDRISVLPVATFRGRPMTEADQDELQRFADGVTLGKPYRPKNEDPRIDPAIDLGRQQEP